VHLHDTEVGLFANLALLLVNLHKHQETTSQNVLGGSSKPALFITAAETVKHIMMFILFCIAACLHFQCYSVLLSQQCCYQHQTNIKWNEDMNWYVYATGADMSSVHANTSFTGAPTGG
jgi:hypothetical protein